MIHQAITKFRQNNFLRSSSIVFVVNILTAFLNYGIIIVVSHALQGDYSLWTALNSLITILLAPLAGLMAEFIKRSSSLAKESEAHAFAYYDFLKKNVRKVTLGGIILSPILALLLNAIVRSSSLFIPIIVIIFVSLQIYTTLNNQFLLGLLSIKNYALSTTSIAASRFIFTVGLVLMGAGVYALPIGFILSSMTGFFLTERLIKTIHTADRVKVDTNNPAPIFNLKKELIGASKTMVVLFSLSMFLNVSPIVAQNFLGPQDRDLLALLFNFGQIIHFGSIAFLGALVAHAARGKNLKIYLTSVSVVSAITITIGIIFWIFGPWIMQLFARGHYTYALPLILWYSLFIAFYNIVYVSTQYLVSHNEYKTLLGLLGSTTILVLSLIYTTGNFPGLTYSGNKINGFIAANITIAALSALYLAIRVWQTREKPEIEEIEQDLVISAS